MDNIRRELEAFGKTITLELIWSRKHGEVRLDTMMNLKESPAEWDQQLSSSTPPIEFIRESVAELYAQAHSTLSRAEIINTANRVKELIFATAKETFSSNFDQSL